MAIFSNAIYVFHSGIPSKMNMFDTICNRGGGNLQGDTEEVCTMLINYVKCTAIVFLLLGIKLMMDTFVNDAPNYLSESYMKAVADQFTQALKYRMIQFQKRSAVAREVEALGKSLYATNIKLQHELASVKLQRIYAKCERFGNSLVFATLTLLPIVCHVFLQFPWYFTALVTFIAHTFFSNRNERHYQTAALEVISDHNLLNLIKEAMPIWTHHDSEPCGWANDMIAQVWDQMNIYATKKVSIYVQIYEVLIFV